MALGSTVGFAKSKPGVPSTPAVNPIRNVYESAATTQAQDYDDIMGGYDALQKKSASKSAVPALNYTPINPATTSFLPQYNYQRSADFGSTVGGFQNFARTGGYSDSDVSNLRERAISPIRSVYSNAKRDLNRQKNLSGGYSPNAGALTAKLAREQSELTSGATTAVNAEIAKMIQSGKLAGLSGLSPLVSGENNLINSISSRNEDARLGQETANAGIVNDTNQFNASNKLNYDQLNSQNQRADDNMELNALQGKQSLYGTTPALTNMFAQQVLQNNAQQMQAVQTANAIKNQRTGFSGGGSSAGFVKR